jgi:hypothetical protein
MGCGRLKLRPLSRPHHCLGGTVLRSRLDLSCFVCAVTRKVHWGKSFAACNARCRFMQVRVNSGCAISVPHNLYIQELLERL